LEEEQPEAIKLMARNSTTDTFIVCFIFSDIQNKLFSPIFIALPE
jgi:hypothetical protein